MSKLENFIVENKKFEVDIKNKDEIAREADVIQKNCTQYIKLLKIHGFSRPLYRAVNNGPNLHEYMEKNVRTNRKPSGTSSGEFPFMNIWLQSHKHIRRDQAVMAKGDKLHLKTFGDIYYFFPIGKFNYTFIKTSDFNLPDNNDKWDPYFYTMLIKYMQLFKETKDNFRLALVKDYLIEYSTDKSLGIFSVINIADIKKWNIFNDDPKPIINKINKYINDNFFSTNKNFSEAYKKGYEMWFDCKKYYLFSIQSPIISELTLRGTL